MPGNQTNQTVSGVRTLMGGGTLGVLALIAILFGAITSNSMNDYTGSLAFQAVGVPLRRPVTAALVAVVAFAAILWMQAGDTASRFQNVLLFIGYWIAPFCAIVMVDWHDHQNHYDPSVLRSALCTAPTLPSMLASSWRDCSTTGCGRTARPSATAER